MTCFIIIFYDYFIKIVIECTNYGSDVFTFNDYLIIANYLLITNQNLLNRQVVYHSLFTNQTHILKYLLVYSISSCCVPINPTQFLEI